MNIPMRLKFLLPLLFCGFPFVLAAQTTKPAANNRPSITGHLQQMVTENVSNLGIVGKEQLMLKGMPDTIRRAAPVQSSAVPGSSVPAPSPATTAAQATPDTLVVRKDTVRLPSSTVYGHDFFRNKDFRIFDRGVEAQPSPNYVIGIGDQIGINIWGYSSFSGSYTVDGTGAIFPEGVGKIYVKGLTLEKAKQLIRSRFASFLDIPNSQVEITIIHARTITVHVVGEVFHPGSYNLPAINTAFNVLVASGGPTDLGSVRQIFVRRGGQTVSVLDVYSFLLDPNAKADYFLENNDYIFVPPAMRHVAISGEVNRPFKYELKEGEDLAQLIAFAGGLTASAYTKAIQIRRFSGGQVQLLSINFDSLQAAKARFVLQNGDEVQINAVPRELVRYVRVSGAAQQPGDYSYSEGMRITDLLAKAGGLKPTAVTDRAYILRKNADLTLSVLHFSPARIVADPGNQENVRLQAMDEVVLFDKRSYVDTMVVHITGGVRMPGQYLYASGMTIANLIDAAGGLKPEAANARIEVSRFQWDNQMAVAPVVVRTISIDKNLKLSEGGFVLQAYDHVFVRSAQQFSQQPTVAIEGEVMFPGTYSLNNKSFRLVDLIQQAGGITQWANANQATLVRAEENRGLVILDLEKALKNPKSRYNILLKPGDVVAVPVTNDLVTLSGMINFPYKDSLGFVNVPYKEGKRAKWYIKRYGLGFQPEAQRARTYVVQPGGLVEGPRRLTFVRIYPKVEQGAYVVVPYTDPAHDAVSEASATAPAPQNGQPVDWNRVIESAMIKVTGLLTLYLLITRINF